MMLMKGTCRPQGRCPDNVAATCTSTAVPRYRRTGRLALQVLALSRLWASGRGPA